ncbi:MAG: hypothetical protein P9X24_08645 [Candidatus Hatepunaea meridiana]|nr:hypothetical protein [Candidatus Hatepunaea meridiana]
MHQQFKFKTTQDLLQKAEELDLNLPFQESLDPLFETITIGSKTIPNRFAVQPMEGFDSNPDGSPSEYTFRRYKRYAEGGSGLIWFEATSVVQEGRSNPRQLLLNKRTLDSFKQLVDHTRQSAHKEFGNSHDPFLVLQITHSGRYSKPEGKPLNKVGCYNPHLDKRKEDITLFSDDELDRLKETLVEAVRLTHKAGFDAVDIKACHGYLLHELLSVYTRTNSRYGGSFENRIRLLVDVVKQAQQEIPEITIAVRMNATDGIPYPYGFGVPEDGSLVIDLSEPKVLISKLIENGCSLLNITTGIPYHSPQLVRPFDRPIGGSSVPKEHPLEGVMRLLNVTGELQREFNNIPFVGTGYSWLRNFYPYIGAAVIERGMASLIGLGRGSFAYPDAPKDLMNTGKMIHRKSCITCSKCTELMRQNNITGCVTRDSEIYGNEYKTIRQD